MENIKISYNMLVFGEEDIDVGIARLAKYGYDGVDIVGEPSKYDVQTINRSLIEHNIQASSICAVFSPERDFVSSKIDVRRNAVAYVKECIDFAAAIKAKAISVQATACMKIESEADERREWNWAIEGIKEAGLYAKTKEINLTLEAWNRYETYLINRVEQALHMVNDIDLPNVGVMGDTYHMNIEEVNLGDAIRSVGKKLYYLHIADSNRAAPGRGHIDFEEVAQALRDIQYDGWISMELLPAAANPFGGKICKEFYDQYSDESIKFLKELFNKDDIKGEKI